MFIFLLMVFDCEHYVMILTNNHKEASYSSSTKRTENMVTEMEKFHSVQINEGFWDGKWKHLWIKNAIVMKRAVYSLFGEKGNRNLFNLHIKIFWVGFL